MKKDENTFEAYFTGKMTSSEALAFSEVLKNDPSIQEDYDYYLAVKKSASLVERDKMRAKLEEIEINETSTEDVTLVKPKNTFLTILKWVGGVAAIFLIAFFTYNSMSTLTPQKLYAQNFEIYNTQAERGASIDKLKEIYNTGNYELFIKNALEAEETPELNMMIANAYMNKDQFSDAIIKLTKISDDSSLRDKKYWYLALSNLKIDNLEEAVKKFNHLQSISNYKNLETEKILSSIRK